MMQFDQGKSTNQWLKVTVQIDNIFYPNENNQF